MRILRVLNNNAVLAKNEQMQQCVILGKGLAFAKRPGDEIIPGEKDKVFIMKGKGIASKFTEIVEQTPAEYIRVCDEIVNRARIHLRSDPSDNIYISLTDHISFAIKRHEQGIDLVASYFTEVRKFYPTEYALGLEALDIIEKRLGTRLPDDEACFIALHIINAWSGGSIAVKNTTKILTLIDEILSITRFFFKVNLQEDTLEYDRFITHLKFFALRVFANDESAADDLDLLETLLPRYQNSYNCVQRIRVFMNKKYQYDLSRAEQSYLLIHIQRVISSQSAKGTK